MCVCVCVAQHRNEDGGQGWRSHKAGRWVEGVILRLWCNPQTERPLLCRGQSVLLIQGSLLHIKATHIPPPNGMAG